jgi:hypothetical protein
MGRQYTAVNKRWVYAGTNRSSQHLYFAFSTGPSGWATSFGVLRVQTLEFHKGLCLDCNAQSRDEMEIICALYIVRVCHMSYLMNLR